MNTTTLHQALDDYRRSIEASSGGQLRPYDQHRLAKVSTLKAHSADLPLASLTFTECSSLVDYWRNRLNSRTGKPFARKSAMMLVSELARFLRWMDRSDECDWRLPRAFDLLDLSVRRLESDRVRSLCRRQSYTVPELSLLSQCATAEDRLLLLLSMNCGMNAAGLLRLRITDFLFDHEHEDAERIGLSSDERHSFLRFVRPRTDQFFEWILWPETVVVVRQAVDRSRSLDIETLFVTKDGRPLPRDDDRDPGACLRNRFRRIVSRVQKDRPEFPSLPFGTLRRSMAELIRRTATSEITGLYLGHGGKPEFDSCRHRPFGELHRALMEIGRKLN